MFIIVQDSLASEIFNLISREAEFSSVLLELIKYQRSYHQTALAVLDKVVPELETVIGMLFVTFVMINKIMKYNFHRQ